MPDFKSEFIVNPGKDVDLKSDVLEISLLVLFCLFLLTSLTILPS